MNKLIIDNQEFELIKVDNESSFSVSEDLEPLMKHLSYNYISTSVYNKDEVLVHQSPKKKNFPCIRFNDSFYAYKPIVIEAEEIVPSV